MLETLSYILYLVEPKKGEETGGAALRELAKLLKDKKLSKLIQNATIEGLPAKAMGRNEKTVHFETGKAKSMDNCQSKKNSRTPSSQGPCDENGMLRDALCQFL
jgi:hypothetical protein